MKEASGELNMTVVTIVAVAAVGAIFYLFVWPIIQRSIVNQTCRTYGDNWQAVRPDKSTVGGSDNTPVAKWACCPTAKYNKNSCVDADLK